MLFPYNKRILARKQRNNMNVAAEKELSVSQAAAIASNRKGGVGVGSQYIRDEIKAGRLKAHLVIPQAGRTYYMIKEQDFQDWEAKRGRPPQENEP
jgi:DNA-binding transcriptional regulator YiaG